jgi:hypothetical protein
LLEDAPGLSDDVVKPFVVAVYGLTSVPHRGLDVLDREESRAPPVRGMRFVIGHGSRASQMHSRRVARRGVVENAKSGEIRTLALCPECATNPGRAVWLRGARSTITLGS